MSYADKFVEEPINRRSFLFPLPLLPLLDPLLLPFAADAPPASSPSASVASFSPLFFYAEPFAAAASFASAPRFVELPLALFEKFPVVSAVI
jgi:hypothetical protein